LNILLSLAQAVAVGGIMAVVAVLAVCLLAHFLQQDQRLPLQSAAAALEDIIILIHHHIREAMEQIHHYQVGLLLRQQVAAVAALE
jgi:hypothetical protein